MAKLSARQRASLSDAIGTNGRSRRISTSQLHRVCHVVEQIDEEKHKDEFGQPNLGGGAKIEFEERARRHAAARKGARASGSARVEFQ